MINRDPLLRFQLMALVLVVPCVLLVLVGLGTGDPWWVSGELTLLALTGVVPAFVVQWQRPVVLWPWEEMAGVNRSQSYGWFAGLGSQEHRVVTILVGVLILVVNRTLYQIAPIFSLLSPLRQEAPGSHVTGLLLALVGMVGLGFALQIGAAAGWLMLLSEAEQAELQGLPMPVLTHIELRLPQGKKTDQQAHPEQGGHEIPQA
jgi:hypothetical protein